MTEFYRYFKENMEALGLPAPESLYGNLQLALASASTILAHIDKFGKRVTLRELAVAGTRLEHLTTVGAVTASFYLGAVIGSIAVATGRSLAGGTTLADVLDTAWRFRLFRPWLAHQAAVWPGYRAKAGRPLLHACHAP